jgi:hypothetical protein
MTGDVSLGTNVKAKFGAGDDLQIYHDGGHSYIQDLGTGNLYLETNGDKIVLRTTDATKTFAKFTKDAAVQLYYADVEKLATTSTGIDVTGSVTCDGFTSTGIDDNATSTAITIDASENVRVDGSYVQIVNTAPSLYLSNGTVQWQMQNTSGNDIVFNNGATEKVRFPYAGGITFNGDTAAANSLDDYETGTFTMSGSPIYNTTCKYIKIGELVTLHGTIKVATGTEKGPWTLSYIPFVCGSYDGAGSIIGATDQSEVGSIRIANGSKDLQYTINQTSVNFDYLSFSITYSTN